MPTFFSLPTSLIFVDIDGNKRCFSAAGTTFQTATKADVRAVTMDTGRHNTETTKAFTQSGVDYTRDGQDYYAHMTVGKALSDGLISEETVMKGMEPECKVATRPAGRAYNDKGAFALFQWEGASSTTTRPDTCSVQIPREQWQEAHEKWVADRIQAVSKEVDEIFSTIPDNAVEVVLRNNSNNHRFWCTMEID